MPPETLEEGLAAREVLARGRGSGDTFSRIEKGGTVTLRRFDRILHSFSDHWPEGLEWPLDSPRPEPSPAEEVAA